MPGQGWTADFDREPLTSPRSAPRTLPKSLGTYRTCANCGAWPATRDWADRQRLCENCHQEATA